MSDSLTPQQAYLAMYAFLDAYWAIAPSDDLAILLGSLSLLPDGSPADAAMKSDWDEAVEKALTDQVDARLRWQSRESDSASASS